MSSKSCNAKNNSAGHPSSRRSEVCVHACRHEILRELANPAESASQRQSDDRLSFTNVSGVLTQQHRQNMLHESLPETELRQLRQHQQAQQFQQPSVRQSDPIVVGSRRRVSAETDVSASSKFSHILRQFIMNVKPATHAQFIICFQLASISHFPLSHMLLKVNEE